MSPLASILTQVLVSLDMRQEDIATSIGVTKAAITFWKQGTNKPRRATIERLIKLASEHQVPAPLLQSLRIAAAAAGIAISGTSSVLLDPDGDDAAMGRVFSHLKTMIGALDSDGAKQALTRYLPFLLNFDNDFTAHGR